MPRPSSGEHNSGYSGGERVFADASGRLWTAVPHVDGVATTIVFTCVNDARQSGRAIVIEPAQDVGQVGDETLRAWLEAAPRIGRLV